MCPRLGGIAAMTACDVRARSLVRANFKVLPHCLHSRFTGLAAIADDYKGKTSGIGVQRKSMYEPLVRYETIRTSFRNRSSVS